MIVYQIWDTILPKTRQRQALLKVTVFAPLSANVVRIQTGSLNHTATHHARTHTYTHITPPLPTHTCLSCARTCSASCILRMAPLLHTHTHTPTTRTCTRTHCSAAHALALFHASCVWHQCYTHAHTRTHTHTHVHTQKHAHARTAQLRINLLRFMHPAYGTTATHHTHTHMHTHTYTHTHAHAHAHARTAQLRMHLLCFMHPAYGACCGSSSSCIRRVPRPTLLLVPAVAVHWVAAGRGSCVETRGGEGGGGETVGPQSCGVNIVKSGKCCWLWYGRFFAYCIHSVVPQVSSALFSLLLVLLYELGIS